MAKYENPAAAVAACREQGTRGAYALYTCALSRRPNADSRWARAARYVASQRGLSGAEGRRKKRRKKA